MTATDIPTNLAETTGELLVQVLPGGTPFLFPSPLMERFRSLIDYERKKLHWDDSLWTRVHSQSRGHYLLDLAEEATALRRELRKPAFAGVPDDLATQSLLRVGEGTGCEGITTLTMKLMMTISMTSALRRFRWQDALNLMCSVRKPS